MIRKQNSIIVLLFIQNNSQFKNIAKTSFPESMLSLSSIVYVQACPAPQIFSKQQMLPSELSSCCFCCFQPLFQLVLALVLTLETSEVSSILAFTTKTTQTRPLVFSVNSSLINLQKAAFLTSFPVKHKILPKLVISNWLW